ncbi:uncharacterized protein LOC143432079 [Xylocopa sonorina]|uniref:uncharacterized protein LOC143432079 n=1 Tax=Xylocopa sonorina TaxID=1818115 RepID=UPI00403B0943
MWNLLKERATQSRSFINVVVDYCGPFFTKDRQYHNCRRKQVYVAVFVCLAVKAAHLETVHDFTIEASIAENMHRKRICINLCSDNETNFKVTTKESCQFLSNQSINWHFIPPNAQHFEGLWEAAVKSYKRHLTRIAETELFTIQRPVSPHPKTFPNFRCSHKSKRRGNTFGLVDVTNIYITSMYINNLTSRSKWTKGSHQITEGKIVLNEENTQSMQWPLERIIQTYPGSDGIERAITVRTASNKFDLTVKKLVPLPIRIDEEDCPEFNKNETHPETKSTSLQ